MLLLDDFQGIRSVDWVAGTAPFYRREVFDKIGLFDESFLMYNEDVEFNLRMRSGTDYKRCMFPDKLVVHYVVPSIPRSDSSYFISRNIVILSMRYARRYVPRILLHNLSQIGHLLVLAVKKMDINYLLSYPHIIRGTIDGLIRHQNDQP